MTDNDEVKRILRVHDRAKLVFEAAVLDALKIDCWKGDECDYKKLSRQKNLKKASDHVYQEIGAWALMLLGIPSDSLHLPMAVYTVFGFSYEDIRIHFKKEIVQNSSRASRKASARILTAFRKHDRHDGLLERIPPDPEKVEDMKLLMSRLPKGGNSFS